MIQLAALYILPQINPDCGKSKMSQLGNGSKFDWYSSNISQLWLWTIELLMVLFLNIFYTIPDLFRKEYFLWRITFWSRCILINGDLEDVEGSRGCKMNERRTRVADKDVGEGRGNAPLFMNVFKYSKSLNSLLFLHIKVRMVEEVIPFLLTRQAFKRIKKG